MEDFELQFCRLCLNSIRDINYRVIDFATREILNNFPLKLNFDAGHKQVMCISCSEKLDAAFKFKSTCLDADRVILPYLDLEHLVPVDLKDIHLKERGSDVLVGQEICRLCMQLTKQFTPALEVDVDIFQKYITEVNLGATLNPIICKSCVDSLVVHSSFIKDCLEVEEKVKHFFSGKAIDSTVDLSHLDLSIRNNGIKKEVDNEMVPKSEINFSTMEETLEEVKQVKAERTEIKLENIKEESCQSSQDLKETPEALELTTKGKEVTMENTPFEAKFCISESSLNTEVFDLEEVEPRVELDTNEHKNSPHIETFMSSHIDACERKWNACDLCGYKTKWRSTLKKHMVIHMDASEVQWFECEICNHKSKTRYKLEQHMINHKEASEIQWYNCDVCDYKTKWRTTLRKHMIIHKDASEINWYQCDLCDYRSNSNGNLKKHRLLHRDASEIQWYGCELCDYKTKWKNSVKKHMRVHKFASELKWYKCDVCDYKSVSKQCFANHIVSHKDASEVELHECNVCDYKSKIKCYLQKHMLMHKDASEVQWHRCNLCSYKSKLKNCLTRHMLIHKDASDVQWYECDLCSYKTKHKGYLKRHLLIHRNVSEQH